MMEPRTSIDHFIQTAAPDTKLSEESKAAMAEALKPLVRPKGYVLLKPWSTCDFLYFIESGLTRTFYIKDDKDVTDWISEEGHFACSIISFITRQPDRRGIEVLEDARMLVLHYNDLEALCRSHHEVETFFRKVVTGGLVQVQQRFDALHFSTARQRYEALLARQASLLQRVPLGMIASYLGMTQETLSRMRAQR